MLRTKMEWTFVVSITVWLYAPGPAAATQICQDLDASACALMHQNDPNLCQNHATAEYACPKFCNLCALTCYHCDDVNMDAANCTSTKTCAVGDRCLLARLSSSIDGHHEYKMNCASLDQCEGREFMPILGRRGIEQRTITTECCTQDLCNNPAYFVGTTATTTAGTTTSKTTVSIYGDCLKDIEIMIHDSLHQSTSDHNLLKNFTKGLVNTLNIDPLSSNIGMVTFDYNVHQSYGLYNDSADALNAVDRIRFAHKSDPVRLQEVVDFLVKGRLATHRSNVDKVVVFVFDSHASQAQYHFGHSFTTYAYDLRPLQQMSHNIIVVNVGSGTLADSVHLPTDSHHVINVPHYSNLPSIISDVVTLICQ